MRKAIVFLFLLLTPALGFAKSGSEHVADMLSTVFDNANVRSPEVRSALYEFTKTIDNFEIVKALPLGKDGHRLYGHWGFSDSIPFNKEPLKGMLERMASTEGQAAANDAKEKIIRAWRSDVTAMENLSARILGVQGRAAKGFAGILYDIHLLGDYSGVKLDALQDVNALKADLVKNVNRLFGNNSSTSTNIINGIEKAYRAGGTAAAKSESMLNFLSRSGEFKSSFQTLLQNERFIGTLIKTPSITQIEGVKSPGELKRIAQSRVGSDIKVAPGLIQNGKLLVALESGTGAGLVTFVIDAGVPSWQYAKGDILKPEFKEKISEAAINGASVGGATAVMVCLGANPAGFAVLGVALGTYLIVDKAQQIYREHKSKSYLTREDLLAFGIPPDSVLDIPIDPGNIMNVKNWYK